MTLSTRPIPSWRDQTWRDRVFTSQTTRAALWLNVILNAPLLLLIFLDAGGVPGIPAGPLLFVSLALSAGLAAFALLSLRHSIKRLRQIEAELAELRARRIAQLVGRSTDG